MDSPRLWYVLVVFAVWCAGFAWLALWLRRRWAEQDKANPPATLADVPGRTVFTNGRWAICPDCKGQGTRRVRLGTSGSFPARCVPCGGDGIRFVYERRAEDSTDAADHVRPMGARSLGLPEDGGRGRRRA